MKKCFFCGKDITHDSETYFIVRSNFPESLYRSSDYKQIGESCIECVEKNGKATITYKGYDCKNSSTN